MTVQCGEHLMYNGKDYIIETEPLYPYLKSKQISFIALHTACWRGYMGDWLIENDKLYLVGLYALVSKNYWYDPSNGKVSVHEKTVDLDELFPGQDKVLADWFTGDICIPHCDLINESECGKEIYLKIKKGIVMQVWEVDHIVKNRLEGVIFGQAIGDALGVGTEFMSRTEVFQNYPGALSLYCQIIQDMHRCRWKPGEWTDDTEMMLCIANAMIEDREIRLETIARNFKRWFKGNPRGIGRHTYNVLSIADYEQDPIRAARMIWELSGRKSAANGALMRTSVVGLWKENVAAYAESICRLTHADPRCVGACVIVSELIHRLVWQGEELGFDEMLSLGRKYDERIEPYLLLAKEGTMENLRLDEGESMGYTLKALSAAVWCLYHVNSFRDGLMAVVNAGGDADTNAAVACSVLGAKYGFEAIPRCFVMGLLHGDVLRKVSADLYQILSAR